MGWRQRGGDAMTQFKHTAGPFRVYSNGQYSRQIISPSLGGVVIAELKAHVHEFNVRVFQKAPFSYRLEIAEMECNAVLFAAAPKLLSALKSCARVLSGEEMSKGALIRALEEAREAMREAGCAE